MTKTETPAALLESARTTLVHARMFFDQGRTNDAARLAYIAAMQAAHAYVLAHGIEPAQLPKPLAYELKNLARLKADYDREPAPHDSSDLARIMEGIERAGELMKDRANPK